MSTSTPISPNIDAIRQQVRTSLSSHWKLLLFDGIVMLVLGMLAVTLPLISTLEVELLVGSLFVVGGLYRSVTILRKRHMPGLWWSLMSGVIAIVLGGMLVTHPLQGVITLTIVMTVFFVIEGIAAIFIALEFRRYLHNWGWTLMSGSVNLVLAYLIWKQWPSSATWVMGLYVGINMIFVGMPLIMIAITARNINRISE